MFVPWDTSLSGGVSERIFLVTYAVISFLRSLARYGARAYIPPLASNTLLVPSRLAFLQRSASGTVLRYALRYCIRSSTRR